MKLCFVDERPEVQQVRAALEPHEGLEWMSSSSVRLSALVADDRQAERQADEPDRSVGV
jgi:hypothetical protein